MSVMTIPPPVSAAIATSVISRAMLPPFPVADFAACVTLAIVKSFLQSLINLPLTDLALTKRFRIRAPIRYRKSQSSRHSVFFSLLHFPQLLLPLLALFRCNLLRRLVCVVGLSIPIQIFALLPASNRSHERVAEIVLALRIVFHVVPFEVDAAAGAFFADRLEEIHGGRLTPSGGGGAFEMFNGRLTDVLQLCCSLFEERRWQDYHMSKYLSHYCGPLSSLHGRPPRKLGAG
jgi:hypothetical protein